MEQYSNPEMGGKKTLWIIGGVIVVIMIIAIIYGATQKSINKKDNIDDILLNGNSTLGGTTMVETPATVATLDLVNLQTFPYKVQARVTGELSDGCSTPLVEVVQSGKSFTLDVAGQKPKDAVCTTVMTPFEKVVDLPVTGITAGTYTVQAGTISKTFTLSADNKIQYNGDK